jgi:CheY-like chemotaxis protein
MCDALNKAASKQKPAWINLSVQHSCLPTENYTKEDFMPRQKISRVFVVDDEKMIAETLALILRKSGYSARYFLNPLEALQVALSEPPDLLISDVRMPQLSGIDLAIRFREQCPRCKILLFSGQAETADLLEVARKQGHYFYLLAKPIHPRDLLRRIREQGLGGCPANNPTVPVRVLEFYVPSSLCACFPCFIRTKSKPPGYAAMAARRDRLSGMDGRAALRYFRNNQ